MRASVFTVTYLHKRAVIFFSYHTHYFLNLIVINHIAKVITVAYKVIVLEAPLKVNIAIIIPTNVQARLRVSLTASTNQDHNLFIN